MVLLLETLHSALSGGGVLRRLSLLLAGLLLLAGCAARNPPGLPPGVQGLDVPPYLVETHQALRNDGERNWVLHLNTMAVAAMRAGDRELAARLLDESILYINDVFGMDPAARRARSLWFAEDAKLFKGDPYERSMTFFYRGILYMQDGDWDNARAAFRAANFQDQFAEEEQFRSDWTIFDYLIAACEIQMGQAFFAREAFERGLRNYKELPDAYGALGVGEFPARPDALRPVTREDNLLVIVQTGRHPRKVPSGRYGQYLTYRRGPSPHPSASIRTNDGGWESAVFTDSVYFQATTRGGRYFDRVAGRKVLFKEGAQTASVVTGIAGYTFLLAGRNDEAAIIGFVLLGLAVTFDILNTLIQPEADTRTWTGVPDALGVYPASLPAGRHALSVRHAGGRMAGTDVSLPPPGAGLTVVLHFPGNDSSLLAPASPPLRAISPTAR